MRVMLLNVAFNRYGGVKGHGGSQIPLNLCYLAAYVRQQHPDLEIQILDAEIEGLSHQQTIEQVVAFKPDLIGVTTNTCVFDSVTEVTGQLKQRLPEVPVVLGGSHPSAIPELTLQDCQADLLVLGEGELTFDALIREMNSGDQAWDTIQGLAYRDGNGQVKINQPRPLMEDLDLLPFPARDLVRNELYFSPPTKNVAPGPSSLISTSRGCPFNCGFCAAHTVWTRRIRFRQPEPVVDEMEECVHRHGVSSFNFADEFFTANKERAMTICELILKRKLGVSWVCSARAQKLDLETLRTMRRAGCHEISFGIESGNLETLKRMDKRLDLDEAGRVINLAKKAGLVTHAGYVLGYMGDTEESIRDTVRVAKSFNTDIAAFFIASPLPGTRLYAEAKEKGYLRAGAKWADYSPLSNNEAVLVLPEVGTERMRQLRRQALRSYYLRPRYVARKVLSLRHWYQVKNLFGGLAILLRIK